VIKNNISKLLSSDSPSFTLSSIQTIFNITRESVRTTASRLVKRAILIRLHRYLYTLVNRGCSLFSLANAVFQPSVISLEITVLTLRGVPALTLNPSFMMTEKLLTLVERQAGRDLFDAWFILKNGYPLGEAMIQKAYGDRTNLYKTILNIIEKADTKKRLRDTGKFLEMDYRNWIRTAFLSDFKRLIGLLSQD